MKKRLQIVLLIVFILKVVGLHSQSDLQWYIVDGKGKTGISMAGNNTYGVSNINNSFVISKVGLTGSAGPKNDIFIIFDKNTHFNSRTLGNNWYEERLGDSTQYYKFTEDPKYLYYTNLYEGEDDPPACVRVNSADELNPAYPTISFTEQISPVYANHDVVIGKDITVIIKNPNLGQEKQEESAQSSNLFKLYFDKAVLEPSNIFDGSSFVYPSTNGNYVVNDNFVSLFFNNNTKYIYLNFNAFSSGGNPAKESINFDLKTSTDVLVYSHSERIRESHDPNYVEVLNIFEKNPREYWAHMHVQCYNDSREAHVNDAQIALSFPATVDASTLELTDWSYGLTKGGLTQVALVKNTDRVYFNFSNVPDILNMQGPDYYYVDPSQVGWVEFIVKINSSDPSEVANINLRPLRPMTFFDGTPYNITKFIDRCFGNLSDRNDLCERKIEGSYYMNQFIETLSIDESRAFLTAVSSSHIDQQVKQCEKDKCSKNGCEKKCKKRKNRFWKRALPWVIAGVMTVIAIAD